MATAIKLSFFALCALIALSHFTEAAPRATTESRGVDNSRSVQNSDLSAAPSERCGYYPNYRPVYNNGYYPNSGFYPNNGYPNNGGIGNNGWNTGYQTGGNGGYGGFGGNGGLTTYYGYGRDDYYGDRNVGFGYQQGTNLMGYSREGDRNLNNYNSYPQSQTGYGGSNSLSSSAPASSGYSSGGQYYYY